MRPRCSILTGGFDFSGCGDCTSCPPFKQAEMSNSEPSAIVLQGILCMCGLYKFRFDMFPSTSVPISQPPRRHGVICWSVGAMIRLAQLILRPSDRRYVGDLFGNLGDTSVLGNVRITLATLIGMTD